MKKIKYTKEQIREFRIDLEKKTEKDFKKFAQSKRNSIMLAKDIILD